MSERERNQITQCRHEKLARQIEESPLNNPTRDYLLRKLKVASSAGYAAVLREYEEEMELYRAAHLPSYKPKLYSKQVRQSPPAPRPIRSVRVIPCAPTKSGRRRVDKACSRNMPRRGWMRIFNPARCTFIQGQFDFLSLLLSADSYAQ